MMKRRFTLLFTILIFFIGAGTVCGDEIVQYYLISPRTVFDLPQRLDPDQPVFSYSCFTGRWKAMVGEEIIFYGLTSPSFNFFFSLNGFLELHNLTNREPVPWELLRANFGFNLFIEVPALNNFLFPKTRVFFEVQCNHESDHILSFGAFQYELIRPPSTIYDFDYTNCSSYEYVKCRMTYAQKIFDEHVRFFATAGGRFFFYTNQFSPRALAWSFFSEAGISYEPAPGGNFLVNLSLFYETIKNNFISGSSGNTIYKVEHAGEDFTYFSLRLSVEIKSAAGFSFLPFVKYFSGNGRGADFLKTYQSFEFGVAFSL
jgi:hypothetical protein